MVQNHSLSGIYELQGEMIFLFKPVQVISMKYNENAAILCSAKVRGRGELRILGCGSRKV